MQNEVWSQQQIIARRIPYGIHSNCQAFSTGCSNHFLFVALYIGIGMQTKKSVLTTVGSVRDVGFCCDCKKHNTTAFTSSKIRMHFRIIKKKLYKLQLTGPKEEIHCQRSKDFNPQPCDSGM